MNSDQLSLEELASLAGMTARNVRAYRTKGLIPPPARVGRRAVYRREHLHRLRAIEAARTHGASLILIARHLAEGRPLADDTAVDWATASPPVHTGPVRGSGPAPGSDRPPAPAPAPRTEIGTLLSEPGVQRDRTAQAQIAQLVAAGVFHREGPRVFTGSDLAAALRALLRQDLPVQLGLGVACGVVRQLIPDPPAG